MKGRSFKDESYDSYRFGFNGMEKDGNFNAKGDDFVHYDFGARIYDARIGRWLTADPMEGIMPSMSPYSYALNNPILLKDQEGELPIIPLLLKAGAAGAVEIMLQISMIYFFDEKVETFEQALKMVDWQEVAWATGEGAIPWKIPGGKLGEAGASALVDLIKNYTKAQMDGTEYSSQMMMQDFIIGVIGDLSGGGIEVAYKRFGKKRVNKLLKQFGGACFVAGTEISGIDGLIPIEEIVQGDSVWAINIDTQELVLKPIVRTFTREVDKLIKIYIGEEIITSSENHPFFVNGEWIEAKNLYRGASFLLLSGDYLKLDSLVAIDTTATVYNFEVADFHTYYVSNFKILVHNDCGQKNRANRKLLQKIEHTKLNNNSPVIQKQQLKYLLEQAYKSGALKKSETYINQAGELVDKHTNGLLKDVWKNGKKIVDDGLTDKGKTTAFIHNNADLAVDILNETAFDGNDTNPATTTKGKIISAILKLMGASN